jgi:CRISPR/Cas system CMR-associated protein Cmr1 (group 7 of RAMP superfamily)
MENFILGKEYTFEQIEESLVIHQILLESGNEIIGERFITIKERHPFFACCSFVMSEYSDKARYRCVYNDKRNPRMWGEEINKPY